MPLNSPLQLVQHLVSATPSVAASLVRSEGVASKVEAHEMLNSFVVGLSAEQRECLAQLLQRERTVSFFDALVHLQEQCESGGWRLESGFGPVVLEPNGYSMAEEYMAKVSSDTLPGSHAT
jgi:hypothetical protein